MHALAVVTLAVVVAVANAGHLGIGLVGAGHGAVVQAPGAHANVVGPDGSHIGVVAAGGTVVANGGHGGVVGAAVAPGLVGHAGLGLGLGVGLAGHGFEGQYIPSGLEHLYDDGSYRAEHHLAGLLH